MDYKPAQNRKNGRFRALPTITPAQRDVRPLVTESTLPSSYQPICLIRLPEVRRRAGGVARATVYDWMDPRSPRHDPTFPVPIKLSYTGGSIAWIEHEVNEWLATRVRAR